MKITYEFDTMDENYDYQEHEMYKQSLNMAVALGKIQDVLRSWLKYDSAPIVDKYSHFWEDLSDDRKKFYEENKIYDLDKMADEIYDAIRDAGVSMEKMGY